MVESQVMCKFAQVKTDTSQPKPSQVNIIPQVNSSLMFKSDVQESHLESTEFMNTTKYHTIVFVPPRMSLRGDYEMGSVCEGV